MELRTTREKKSKKGEEVKRNLKAQERKSVAPQK